MRTPIAVLLACLATQAISETKIVVHGPSSVLDRLTILEDRLNEETLLQHRNGPVRLKQSNSQRAFGELCQEIDHHRRFEDNEVDVFITYHNLGESSASFCWGYGSKGIVELALGHYAPLMLNNWHSSDESILQDFGGLRTNFISFNTSEIYSAFAEAVLLDGELQTNPYYYWSEINPGFPSERIRLSLDYGSSIGDLMFAGCKETGAFDQMITEGRSVVDASEQCRTLHQDPDRVLRSDTTTSLLRVANERIPAIIDSQLLTLVSDWHRQSKLNVFVSKLNDSFPSENNIVDGTYPSGGSLRAYFRISDVSEPDGEHTSRIELLADLLAIESISSNGKGSNQFGLQIDPRWSDIDGTDSILASKATPCPKPEKAKCPTPVGTIYPEQ